MKCCVIIITPFITQTLYVFWVNTDIYLRILRKCAVTNSSEINLRIFWSLWSILLFRILSLWCLIIIVTKLILSLWCTVESANLLSLLITSRLSLTILSNFAKSLCLYLLWKLVLFIFNFLFTSDYLLSLKHLWGLSFHRFTDLSIMKSILIIWALRSFWSLCR
jgi:hypothetical protein